MTKIMENLNLATLGGNVSITFKQSDLTKFARSIAGDAVDNYRNETTSRHKRYWIDPKERSNE